MKTTHRERMIGWRTLGILSGAAIATLSLLAPARGDLIVEVAPGSSAPAGGTGSLYVLLAETNGGTDAVNNFTVQLELSSPGVAFTGADTNTAAAAGYIFTSLQSPPFTSASFPNTNFSASDADNNPPFEALLNDGDVVGLEHVTYSVAKGTPAGPVTVTVGPNTVINDLDIGDAGATFQNGQITVTAPAGHALFSVTSSAPSGYGSAITNGASAPNVGHFTGPGAASNKLTVTGSNGGYNQAQVTGIGTGGTGDATNYVEANGFNPGSDKQIFGFDVEVNGSQASTGQINTLISEINSFGGGLASGLSVSNSLTNDPFPATYNLFLTANPGIAADNFVGFDVSSGNDPALTGYTISAVDVVPEPVSLSALAFGGLWLMSRRKRTTSKI